MSEYVNIEVESTDDPDVMYIVTNLTLSIEDEAEDYPDREAGDEGSPLAQSLFAIPDIASLTIEGSEMTVRRVEDAEWHDLIEDISDVIRDFFL